MEAQARRVAAIRREVEQGAGTAVATLSHRAVEAVATADLGAEGRPVEAVPGTGAKGLNQVCFIPASSAVKVLRSQELAGCFVRKG